MRKVVLYSNRHRVDDNRIVELEAIALANAGFETVVYGKTQGVKVVYDNIRICTCKDKTRDCVEQCIKENADIYIFHDPGLLRCAQIVKRTGKTVFFDAHENYEEKLKTRMVAHFPFLRPFRKLLAKMWWIYEKTSVEKLSGKICADRTVKKKYGRRTYLLPNMPSRRFFENNPERTSSTETFRLIYVGSMSWERGIIQTAEAIRLCEHKNIEFHIIGDTKDDRFKKIVNSFDFVVWHGRVPWLELKDYLVNCDAGTVLLQPTEAYLYCPGENIVKLWEYMSIGLPVLISDFPPLVELNQKIKFGLNVKPDEPSQIAEAIDWMIEHPDEIKDMGRNGRSCVLETYNAESYTTGLVEFLKKYEQI